MSSFSKLVLNFLGNDPALILNPDPFTRHNKWLGNFLNNFTFATTLLALARLYFFTFLFWNCCCGVTCGGTLPFGIGLRVSS